MSIVIDTIIVRILTQRSDPFTVRVFRVRSIYKLRGDRSRWIVEHRLPTDAWGVCGVGEACKWPVECMFHVALHIFKCRFVYLFFNVISRN